MKLRIIIFLLAISPLSAAQVTGKLFYDKLWRLTKKDSAMFYRTFTLDTASQKFSGEAKDYTKDDKLIMTTLYKDGARNGLSVTYFRNGQKESEGNFEDNVRKGTWKYFYSNGTQRQEVQYGDFETRIMYLNDSAGTKLLTDGNGFWTEEYVEPYTGAKIITNGEFRNHQKEGTWTSTLSNGSPWITSIYKSGRFVSGEMTVEGEVFELFGPVKNLLPMPYRYTTTESFASTRIVSRSDYKFIKSLPAKTSPSQLKKADEVLSVTEYSAYPVGGLPAFYKAVGENIKYPAEAKKLGLEGRVFVEFVINRNGTLSDFKVIKGLGKGCDEEAIRAIKASMTTVKWKPAIQLRKLVRQRYTLPIPFRLTGT